MASEDDRETNLGWFEKFLNIVRGKVDVKNRLSLLLNPDNPITSTQLSRSEVDFVSTSFFVADEFPVFQPLANFAKQFCLTSISREGWGVDQSIRLNAAISESKLAKALGILKTEEPTRTVKGKA